MNREDEKSRIVKRYTSLALLLAFECDSIACSVLVVAFTVLLQHEAPRPLRPAQLLPAGR